MHCGGDLSKKAKAIAACCVVTGDMSAA